MRFRESTLWGKSFNGDRSIIHNSTQHLGYQTQLSNIKVGLHHSEKIARWTT